MTLSNWSITLLEGVTLFALIAGPISSVCIGVWLEKKRDAHNRKWEMLRMLMRDRSQITTLDYVGALNMVDAEFHNDKEIKDALDELYNHTRRRPKSESETMSAGEKKFLDLNANLIQKIAKSLNVKLDKKRIFKRKYIPHYMTEKMREEDWIRIFLSKVAVGEMSFPVSIREDSRTDAAADS